MLSYETRKFLTIVISVQAAMLGLMGLAALGFDIPVLRQLVGFIYLTFIPGLLILRILKLHNLGNTETLLYSVGLSIASVMFLGFFMNTFYPLVDIPRPISPLPLTITLTVTVAILCSTVYIQERRGATTSIRHRSVPWAEIFSPPVLFLLLLPLLSTVGAYYLANFYQNNTLLLVLIALITLVAVLVAFNRFIPPKLYPLAIAMISISLLWHWSLISQYIWGYDIHHEYYFQNLVLSDGFWDSSLRSNVNSMLSIAMLGPIYSLLLDMSAVWILKIVYPLFFSLLPLALFQIFRKQSGDRVAFYAVFFFMSFSTFFMGMLQLARQQLAELFFALFVLSLLDSTMAVKKRTLLLIIWGFSVGVSHYGLSYFYLFYLILALLLLPMMNSKSQYNIWERFKRCFGRRIRKSGISEQALSPPGITPTNSPLTPRKVFIFTIFFLTYFMYIGAGSPFNSIVNIGVHTYHSISELFVPEAREPGVLLAVGLTSPEITSIQRSVFLAIQYVIQFFIVAGVIGLLLNRRKNGFQPVYIAMTLVSSLLLLLSIVLPYFAGSFNMDRIYHITLLFLAPFCVLGGITAFRWLSRALPSRFSRALTDPVSLKLVVILILVPYFLFSTAFIYAVTGDTVTSIALNPELDNPRYNEQEIFGKEWLLSNIATGARVATDYYGIKWLVEPPFLRNLTVFYGETEKLPDNIYVSLRSINVKQAIVKKSPEEMSKYVDLPGSAFGTEVLAHRSLIYSNGGAQIYR